MKKISFLFCLLCLHIYNIYAQNNNPLRVIRPETPQVASILKFEEYPVNLYTGVPDISIPIYNIKLGSLQIPITLKYHASGIKVDETASWVGLGWMLNPSGVITKSVRGKDDMTSTPIATVKSLDQMTDVQRDDYLYGALNSSNIDTEPDLYFVSMPGFSGRFMQFPDGSFRTFPVSDVKITLKYYDYMSYWEVVNQEGYKFIFGVDPTANPIQKAREFNTVTTVNNPILDQFQRSALSSFTTDMQTGWYLIRIESPNQEFIRFDYEDTKYAYKSSPFEKAEIAAINKFSLEPILIERGYNINNVDGVRLKGINFNNGSIKFINTQERKDILPQAGTGYSTDKCLDQIQVINTSNELVKQINFNYNYFSPTGTVTSSSLVNTNTAAGDSYLNYRLKLESLDFVGLNNLKETYKFNYEEQVNLPNRSSPATDYWGYYNNNTIDKFLPKLNFYNWNIDFNDVKLIYGNNGITLPASYGADQEEYRLSLSYDGAIKDAFPAYTKANVLKQIIYPTGGNTEFTFENNTVKGSDPYIINNPVPNIAAGIVTNFAGDSVHAIVKARYNDYPSSVEPQTKIDYVVRIGRTDFINYKFEVVFQNLKTAETYIVDALRPMTENNEIGDFIKGSIVVKLGTYRVYIKPKYGVDYPDFTASVELNWMDGWTPTVPPSAEYPGAGLRVSSIKSYDPILKTSLKKTYDYKDEFNNSSGELLEYPNYLSFFRDQFVYNNLEYTPLIVNYTSLPDRPFLTSQSSYSGYTRVKETLVSNEPAENLIKVYTFSGKYLDTDFFAKSGVPVPYNFQDWRVGLPLTEEHFLLKNQNYSVLKRITNEYTFKGIDNEFVNTIGYSYKAHQKMLIYVGGVPVGSTYFGLYRRYTLSTERYWKRKVKIEDYDYSTTTPRITTKTEEFDYENPLHTQLTKKTLTTSLGDKQITYLLNPLDYTSGNTTIDALRSKNILMPIETVSLIQKSNKSIIVGAQLNQTDVNGNITELKRIEPLTELALSSFKFSNKLTNGDLPFGGAFSVYSPYSPYVKQAGFTYATNGALIAQQREKGPVENYLYNNTESNVIAIVSNGSAGFAYSSFEADAKGNWDFTGTPEVGLNAPTGTKVYNLSNGAISKSGLTATTEYLVSYWTKNSSAFTITGTQAAAVKIKSFNGWNLYEHTVKGVASVSISGTGLIDELRLYPSDAQMTTYTYEPLVGMTSSTDTKGQTSYYEYDDFQRLKWTKDQEGNIIKAMDYHYQNQ